jgi:hypothetical protein
VAQADGRENNKTNVAGQGVGRFSRPSWTARRRAVERSKGDVTRNVPESILNRGGEGGMAGQSGFAVWNKCWSLHLLVGRRRTR